MSRLSDEAINYLCADITRTDYQSVQQLMAQEIRDLRCLFKAWHTAVQGMSEFIETPEELAAEIENWRSQIHGLAAKAVDTTESVTPDNLGVTNRLLQCLHDFLEEDNASIRNHGPLNQ